MGNTHAKHTCHNPKMVPNDPTRRYVPPKKGSCYCSIPNQVVNKDDHCYRQRIHAYKSTPPILVSFLILLYLYHIMNSDLESLVKTNQVEEALAVATREASSAMDNVYVRVLQKYKERLHEMERATAAELKDNAEIDFIKQLPYDVVSQIVTYLWHATSDRDDESPAFLYVSKHWRRAILEATPYLFYRFSRGMHPDHTKDLVIALRSRIRRMGIDPAHTPFPQILGPNLVHLQHLRLGKATSCIPFF